MEQVIPPQDDTFESFFQSLGLKKSTSIKILSICEAQDIDDISSLLDMQESDLKEVGFTLGVLKKLRPHLTSQFDMNELHNIHTKLTEQREKQTIIIESYGTELQILEEEVKIKMAEAKEMESKYQEKKKQYEAFKILSGKVQSLLDMSSIKFSTKQTMIKNVLAECKSFDESFPLFQFNPKMSNKAFLFSNNQRTLTYNGNGKWYSATCYPLYSFTVRVKKTTASNIMIGFCGKDLDIEKINNFKINGFYLTCYGGTLYSEKSTSSKTYYNKKITDGSLVTATFSPQKKNISFKINGNDCGVAFTIDKLYLLPSVICCDKNDVVELIEN